MNIFTIFFIKFFKQNILQNTPNCIILKKFLCGACPRTPLTNPPLFQKYFDPLPPPPPPEMKS